MCEDARRLLAADAILPLHRFRGTNPAETAANSTDMQRSS